MTRRVWIALALAVVYSFGVYTNTGFSMASWQSRVDPEFNRERYRDDLSFSVFISLTPIGWFVTFFTTGFYEHGWMRPNLYPEVRP